MNGKITGLLSTKTGTNNFLFHVISYYNYQFVCLFANSSQTMGSKGLKVQSFIGVTLRWLVVMIGLLVHLLVPTINFFPPHNSFFPFYFIFLIIISLSISSKL